jgi:hypothetical protein
MDKTRLLEICQWDFLSYSEALSTSPFGTEKIRYSKMSEPLKVHEPSSLLPVLSQRDTYEIRIGRDPFGFFAWMPTCKDDRALVLEYKTKPKPWTAYKSRNEDQAKFISSTIEAIMGSQGFLVGVSCIGVQLFVEQFMVMFARNTLNPMPVAFTFYVSHRLFFEYQSNDGKVEYLDGVASEILCQRKQCQDRR